MRDKNTLKNFLHILWSGEIGGTEEYVLTLAKFSDRSIYKMNLCFLSSKGQIYEEAKKINNIDVSYIGIRNGFDIRGAIKFARYLYKGNFDIVHSHMRNFICTAVLFLFTVGVPKILTHHIGPVNAQLFGRERRFYKLFSGVFKIITAISGAVKENLIRDLGVKPVDKIKVIHNGIDLDKFNTSGTVPSDLKDINRSDKVVIGFVGRMEYYKRPLLFIDIASKLIEKDSNFYFVMVGDGPELNECEKLIDTYAIREYFRLLGFRRDIPEILGLFDAVLFTTSGEGFGIVIVEAMSMGIPVFAINDGAVPEIIKHKDNGILLYNAEPESVADQIFNVLRDEKLIDRIKERSAEDVHSRFSISSSVQEMNKVYQSVM